MGETYRRLVSPLTGETERGALVVVNNINNNSLGDLKQAAAIERVWRDVIEGIARDVPPEGDRLKTFICNCPNIRPKNNKITRKRTHACIRSAPV